MADVISLDTYAFLEWLLSCESREEMHNAIRALLHANPRPPTSVQIMARIDDALTGWYQACYDPRRVAQGIAELEGDFEVATGGGIWVAAGALISYGKLGLPVQAICDQCRPLT